MTSTPSTSVLSAPRPSASPRSASSLPVCASAALGWSQRPNPASAFGQAVGTAAHAAGVDWSDVPEGYTRAQYEAFWDAEYSGED